MQLSTLSRSARTNFVSAGQGPRLVRGYLSNGLIAAGRKEKEVERDISHWPRQVRRQVSLA